MSKDIVTRFDFVFGNRFIELVYINVEPFQLQVASYKTMQCVRPNNDRATFPSDANKIALSFCFLSWCLFISSLFYQTCEAHCFKKMILTIKWQYNDQNVCNFLYLCTCVCFRASLRICDCVRVALLMLYNIWRAVM